MRQPLRFKIGLHTSASPLRYAARAVSKRFYTINMTNSADTPLFAVQGWIHHPEVVGGGWRESGGEAPADWAEFRGRTEPLVLKTFSYLTVNFAWNFVRERSELEENCFSLLHMQTPVRDASPYPPPWIRPCRCKLIIMTIPCHWNQLPDSLCSEIQSFSLSPLFTHASSLSALSPLSSPSLLHSRLKITPVSNTCHHRLFSITGLISWTLRLFFRLTSLNYFFVFLAFLFSCDVFD